MTYLGIDTAARLTAEQAHKLVDNGVSFVGRYLVPSGWKALTAEEIVGLRGAGLAILLCWEIGGEAMKGGAAQGAQDGARARQLAEKFGVPSGTTIFFAADYNVPQSDLIQCEQYILAAQSALGKYVAGIYGGQKVCEFLHDRGTTKRIWQCVAWSNIFIDAANVRQYAWPGAAESKAMQAKIGVSVDMNSTEDMRKAGLWMPYYNEYADGDSTIIEPVKHWYDDTVLWAEKEGVIAPVKTIADARPNDYGTRAEMMQMIRNYATRNDEADDKTDSGLLS